MLSDYERQMCRDCKKRLDMAQTPQGQIATVSYTHLRAHET